MKNILKTLLILVVLTSCTSNRYVLNNNNKEDKTFLIKEIKKAKKEGKISSKKPIIVIDGVPKRYANELKENKLNLSKEDIKNIEILKQDVGERIYGDFAKGGVFIVTTKSNTPALKQKKDETKLSENANIFFIVDGKEIDKDLVFKMDPNTIHSLTVIKDKEEIKKYTDKDYEGVIIIELKK